MDDWFVGELCLCVENVIMHEETWFDVHCEVGVYAGWSMFLHFSYSQRTMEGSEEYGLVK